MSWFVLGVSSCTNDPALGAGVVTIFSIVGESKNRCRITFLIFTTEGVRDVQNSDNQYLSRSGNGGLVLMTMTMTLSDL